MKNTKTTISARSAQVLFAFLFFTILSATIGAQNIQLPIEFYTDKLIPIANDPNRPRFQSWSDPASGNNISIDAYNKRNLRFTLGLPTTVEGRVMIQPLENNLERVTVVGQTRNALCVGFSATDILFGYSLGQVLNHVGPAALGDVNYRIVFAPQPAGQFNPIGAGLEFFGASITCGGPLRAASGFAEGTPGFAQTRQSGLYNTKAGAGCPPEKDADCYPAEKVQFKPRGQ